MVVHDSDVEAEALKNLAIRIDAQVRDFRKHSEFSDIAAAALKDARARRDLIQGRLDKALREGKLAAIVVNEIRRDFNGVLDDLAEFAHHLDTEAMKHREQDQVPPKS
jgi:hypothetical protein